VTKLGSGDTGTRCGGIASRLLGHLPYLIQTTHSWLVLCVADRVLTGGKSRKVPRARGLLLLEFSGDRTQLLWVLAKIGDQALLFVLPPLRSFSVRL
jgi:hypothetical protein